MVSELTGPAWAAISFSWSKGISAPKGNTLARHKKAISAHSSSLGKPVIPSKIQAGDSQAGSSPVLRLFALLGQPERNPLFRLRNREQLRMVCSHEKIVSLTLVLYLTYSSLRRKQAQGIILSVLISKPWAIKEMNLNVIRPIFAFREVLYRYS